MKIGYGTFVRRGPIPPHPASWHIDHDGNGQWRIVTEEPELEMRRYWNVDAVLCRCITIYEGAVLVYLSRTPTPAPISQSRGHTVLATGTYDSLWDMFLDYARML
jgi:hypothetical protein